MKLILASLLLLTAHAFAADNITVRTEMYPRPPYSGATYYIYEQGGNVICTKLQVCNKFDNCEVSYFKGVYKDSEDVQTGAPFDTTPAVAIPVKALKKHICLTKFSLLD